MDIKEIMIRSNLFLRSYKVINNLFYKKAYEAEVLKRRSFSLFDYKAIAAPLNRFYYDYVPENNDKCMACCLKQYMGVAPYKSLNTVIEHGLFFGDFVSYGERLLNVPSIITFGSQRIKHLTNKGINKQIIPIGPYIHYASPFLSEDEFFKLKNELGRVLLVFPSHSLASEGSVALYDVGEFTREIGNVAKGYDTVLISLHYSDIKLGEEYEKLGYRCVSSGHTNDPAFMSRQRTLIELADMTMSNNAGTHVGYCVYLGKPHYVFRQKVELTRNEKIEKKIASWRSMSLFEKEANEVISAFCDFSREITQHQNEVVNKYWGTEYIRTPDELMSLLKL